MQQDIRIQGPARTQRVGARSWPHTLCHPTGGVERDEDDETKRRIMVYESIICDVIIPQPFICISLNCSLYTCRLTFYYYSYIIIIIILYIYISPSRLTRAPGPVQRQRGDHSSGRRADHCNTHGQHGILGWEREEERRGTLAEGESKKVRELGGRKEERRRRRKRTDGK